MARARIDLYRGLAVALVLTAVGLTSKGRAAEDDPKARALALNQVTGDDPIEGQIKALVGDEAGSKKLLAVAVTLAKAKDQPFTYNGAYILARTAQELKDLEAGRLFYQLCVDQAAALQSGRKLFQAHGGLIDLYFDNKKYEECVKAAQRFLEIKGNRTVEVLKPAVQETLIQALARLGKVDEALKLVDNLVEADEDGWYYLRLKGSVLSEVGRPADAAKAFEEVLTRINKDKALKKDERTRFAEGIRYRLSGVYVDMDKVDKAADHLKALLEQKPNSPTYNNDLGYIWADHDMKLDEAEKLIRKAIDDDREQRKTAKNFNPQTDRDNAAYLDSLGWVLFKKKKYAEAKTHLLEAVKDKEGQHVEIFDHLGDVHMALGEKSEALAAWKKGIEAASDSKREQDRKAIVEKKINAQK